MLRFKNCFILPDGSYGGYQEWSDGYGIRRPEFEKAMAVAAGNAGAQILMDAKFLNIERDKDGQICGVVFNSAQRGRVQTASRICLKRADFVVFTGTAAWERMLQIKVYIKREI